MSTLASFRRLLFALPLFAATLALAAPRLEVAPSQVTVPAVSGQQASATLSLHNTGDAPLEAALEPGITRRVLVLACRTDLSQILPLLQAIPELGGVDVWDVGQSTPDLMALKPYAAVMTVFHDQRPREPVTLGNVLADYVDQGGGVVLTLPSFRASFEASGRLLDGGYMPFAQDTGLLQSGNLGTFDPGHPIMAGVHVLHADAAAVLSPAPGATLVASWDSGMPLVVTREHVVGINLSVSVPGEWSGDAPRLLANALLWSARAPWLSLSPAQATLAPGEERLVTLTFDASGLDEGPYEGDVLLTSNDPSNPSVHVPARMDVTGTPAVALGGGEQVLESIADYHEKGASTQHAIALGWLPDAVRVELLADGDYEAHPGEGFGEATLTVEGNELGNVSNYGVDHRCEPAWGQFPLTGAALAAVAADRTLEGRVQNNCHVYASCAVNRHTVRVRFDRPADRVECDPTYVGGTGHGELRLRNTGTALLRVSAIASSDPVFAAERDTVTLRPGAEAIIAVRFRPLAVGDVSGALTVSSDDPATPAATIAVHGTGLVAPDIAVAPLAVSADLYTGGTAERAVTVRNRGAAPLELRLQASSVPLVPGTPLAAAPAPQPGAGDASLRSGPRNLPRDGAGADGEPLVDWLSVTPAEAVIPPGGSLEATLTLDASFLGSGDRDGYLLLSSDDPDEAELPVTAHLRVTGAPDLRGFGRELTSESRVTVTTSGAVTTHQLAVSPAPAGPVTIELEASGFFGVYDSDYCGPGGLGRSAWLDVEGRTLGSVGQTAPNDCLTLQAAFAMAPREAAPIVADGLVEATVRNSADVEPVCEQNEHVVRVRYRESARVAFADTPLGACDASTFTLRNAGVEPLTVSGISLDDASFTVSPTSFTLAPGAEQELALSFCPASAGDHAATMSVASNDPDAAVTAVALTGRGIAPPALALSSVSVDADAFMGESVTRTLEIRNPGGAPLTFRIFEDTAPGPGVAPGDPGTAAGTEPDAGPARVSATTQVEPTWLTFEPASGSVPPGSSVAVSFHFTTSGLLQGEFRQDVILSSNDANRPNLRVPVTLRVAEVAATLTLDGRALEAGGPWLKATLTVPEPWTPGDVDLSSVRLNGVPSERAQEAGDVAAPGAAHRTAPAGTDGLEGPGGLPPKLMFRVDRAAVLATFGAGASQSLSLSGTFTDGPHFLARALVTLRGAGAAPAASLAPGRAGGAGTDEALMSAAPLVPSFAMGPNPMRGGSALRVALTLPRAGWIAAEVYSPAGRLVRTLAAGTWPAGRMSLEWDGRDRGGRAVEPGVYLVRVLAPGINATRRAVVLR